ncbi:hypothetical protein [Streptomyces sp. NPDC048442]
MLYGTAAVCAVGAVAIAVALAPPRRNAPGSSPAPDDSRLPVKVA